MTQNNNFSPLPWYSSKEEWNSRKSYAYGNIYPLFAPAATLLPFQIAVPHGSIVMRLLVYGLDDPGNPEANITHDPAVEATLQVLPSPQGGYDVVSFPGTYALSTPLSEGVHYMALNIVHGGTGDSGEWFYSEQFTVVKGITPYLTVEWWDNTDLVFDAGCVLYQGGYRNRLHFIAEIGKPGYEYEEEGEQRDGYFFPEKQLSWKTYRFTVLAPEYLCDVMRFIALADHVRITDGNGRVYTCDTFGLEVDWQVQGDLAAVEAEFTTDTAVKKIPTCGTAAAGGDFNNDFNNDFSNAG